jgi:hypothetical protein
LIIRRGGSRTQAKLGTQMVGLIGSATLGIGGSSSGTKREIGRAGSSRGIVIVLLTSDSILKLNLLLKLCLGDQFCLILLVLDGLRL